MLRKAALIFLCLALLTQRAAVGVGSACWGLTIALTLCIIYREKRAGRLSLLPERSRALLRAIGIYFLCLLPSLIFSYDSTASLQCFAHRQLYFTVPVLMGIFVVTDSGERRLAFASLMLAMLIESVLVVYRRLALTGAQVHAVGFKGHHSLFGSLCAFVGPMLAVVCMDENFERRERVCAFTVLTAVLAAAFFLGSRASWLCLMITLPLVCLPYVWKNKKKLLCCLCCILLLTVAFGAFDKYGRRMSSITDIEENASNLARLHMWNVSIMMFKEHPLGIGLGQYDAVNERYYKEKYSTRRLPLKYEHCHNIYLDALTEGGLPALAGLLYLYLSVLYGNVRAYLKTRRPEALMLAGGIAAIIIFGLVDMVNTYKATMTAWWFLAGAFTMAQEENK